MNDSGLQSGGYCITSLPASPTSGPGLVVRFICLTYEDGRPAQPVLWPRCGSLHGKQFPFFLHLETFNLGVFLSRGLGPPGQREGSDASSLPAFPQIRAEGE